MPEFSSARQFGRKAPDEIFARVGFSGDHSRTIQLVQSGAYEVGVLDYLGLGPRQEGRQGRSRRRWR